MYKKQSYGVKNYPKSASKATNGNPETDLRSRETDINSRKTGIKSRKTSMKIDNFSNIVCGAMV